jgi:hypothetical protein
MIEKHEFEPGGVLDGRFDESDRCCMCGEAPDHTNHYNEDGTEFVDTDSVFARMDARGNVRPK